MKILKSEMAAPATVDPTSFHLDDVVLNKEKLKSLKKKQGKKVALLTLGTGEQCSLVKTGDSQGAIYLEYKGELGVYIQYHTYHYSFLPVKSITQTRLWRNKKLPVSNTFSPTLFFKVILEQTGAVLSDLEHTPDGEEFWKRRLREALVKNLNVGLVNFGSHTFQQIRSKKELETLMEATWGGGMQREQFKQLRWMVWK
jgi:hypothetical protein